MRKMVKFLSILVVVFMVATLAAACGRSSSTNDDAASTAGKDSTAATSTAAAPALKKVPLIIMVAGTRPKQQDEVLANLNKVTENELNMDLKVNYIEWGDYINQVKLKSAGGEEFDIFLSFFSELAGNISRKQCIDLNDLLGQYGPDLKAQIPQNLWDTLTVDGKIYGIPAVYAMTEMGRGFLVRKDLRLKYNLPEITDLASEEKFLDTIAKNEPSIIPFLGTALDTPVICDKDSIGHSIYTFGPATLLYVNEDVRPLKVENYLKTDIWKKVWAEDIKAYESGWFEKDILSDTDRDGKFIAGKAAAMAGDLYNINDRLNALKKNVPDADIELAIINKEGTWQNIGPVNNFGMISSTSRNPERAMMFMNWLRKSQENYDLYMLGIEGVTYNMAGDKAEVPAGIDPTDKFAPTPWFTMHFPYLKLWTTDSPAYIDALNFWNSLKPESTPLQTFSYSSDNVSAEKAAIEKIGTDEVGPLQVGMLKAQADYEKVLADLDKAGMQKVIEDAQKQIDAFVAKNNIK